MTDLAPTNDVTALREENQTLYGVIKLVSSSLELGPMLHGVVELATEATDCHACFIYLLTGDQLTIRAASPVFGDAVDKVSFPVSEGLTGWVARQKKPEFIRERALEDPRMRYVPLLEEERFQSMVAVPILSRAGETIGVIVLHTEAPREFGEDTLTLLVHIASLVSGAIENAQSYDRERRRVDALTGLSALSNLVAAADQETALAQVVTRGLRELIHAESCQLYKLEEASGTVELLAAAPAGAANPATSAADLLLDETVVTVSLTAGTERIGVLCAHPAPERPFAEQDQEVLRAVAHLVAIALKRLELIEGLTKANIVKDLFEALAAGATEFAAAKAAEVRCDMTMPYMLLCALPAGGHEPSSGAWREAAEALSRELAGLAPRSAIEAGPGPVRALLAYEVRRPERIEQVIGRCRELGIQHGAVIGIAEMQSAPVQSARAFREARDAATIGSALLGEAGGAISYGELGAYRYLVNIKPEDAPQDRVRIAVDTLIDYDRQRRTALLDTLERFLAERSSVIDSARVLYIHPNTMRQRLGRIEELTGLQLDQEDLLSLELAIKLARLHGRPSV